MNQASKFNRLLTMLTLTIMLLAIVPTLFAEGPYKRRPHSPGMGNPHFEYGNKIPYDMILEKLEPTEKQIEKIYALEDEIRKTTRSQRKQIREIKKRLKTELELDEPVAIEVGKLVISRKNLSQKIRKSRRSFRESIATILTPEQLKKFRAYRRKFQKFNTVNHHQKPDGNNTKPEWGHTRPEWGPPNN